MLSFTEELKLPWKQRSKCFLNKYQGNWARRNKERINRYARNWRKKRSELNIDYFPELNRKRITKDPVNYLIKAARRSAKVRNLEFNLTREDITIPDICPVLNIPLKLSDKIRTDNSPSIDRFDNSLGYTKGNVNVISWRANELKRNGTLEEFRSLVRWLEDGKKTRLQKGVPGISRQTRAKEAQSTEERCSP